MPPSTNEYWSTANPGGYGGHWAVNAVWFEIMQAGSAEELAPHSTPGVELVDCCTSTPFCHLKMLMIDVLPPFVKSLVMRRSPFLWVPTKLPPLVPLSRPTLFWKNQNPTAFTPLEAGLS